MKLLLKVSIPLILFAGALAIWHLWIVYQPYRSPISITFCASGCC